MEWLRLHDFRNIPQAYLRFGPGLNLITGANGQGKSNLLEAVGLLATGRSFRRVPPGVMRRGDQPWFRVSGGVQDQGMSRQLEFFGDGKRQVVHLDGKPMAAVSLMERVLVAVIVTPETPLLVRGGPGERRDFLDWVIFSANRRHGTESREYHRALRARNQLLKRPGRDSREIDAWEAHLAILGARIAWRRHEVVTRLAGILPGFLDGLDLVCDHYNMVLEGHLEPMFALVTHSSEVMDGAITWMRNALAANREADQRRGLTGVGPHRDELLLQVDGRLLSRFGSRGEQKRFAFALKLAEAQLLEETLGQSLVLVLDDPSSELDRNGMQRLMTLLAGHGRQLFVAAREAEEIPWPDSSLVVHAVD
ncbi:MAG: DNA replication and repair protein RecF, partial [Magnetococcales bacterium]|nr:DNA replication and repair protein RecF [Magnetococcales bacterium]